MKHCRENVYPVMMFLGILAWIVCVPGESPAQNTKKVGAHNFQLPEDWPVEKRGGLITPLPTEEYVSIKFTEIEKEFQAIKTDLADKVKGLQESLRGVKGELEEEVKKRDRSDEEWDGKRAKIMGEIEQINAEVNRLNRKITKDIKEMRLKLKELGPELEYIKDNLDGLQNQIYRLEEKIDYYQDD